jgi:hypothetical protein
MPDLDDLDKEEYMPISELPPDAKIVGYATRWVDPINVLDDDIIE